MRIEEKKFIDILNVSFFIFIINGIVLRVERFSFELHFLSDIGLYRINGNSNILSLFLFSLAVFCISCVFLKMFKIYKIKTSEFSYNKNVAYCFLFSSISGYILIFFPKDVLRVPHGYISNLLIGGYLIAVFLMTEQKNTTTLKYVNGIIFGIYFLYVLSFIIPFTTNAIMQKVFISTMVLSLSFYARL